MSTNINTGHNGANRRKRRTPDKTRASGPVVTITVDPQIWRDALGIAGGNPHRIERHAGFVIVRNHAWQVNHG